MLVLLVVLVLLVLLVVLVLVLVLVMVVMLDYGDGSREVQLQKSFDVITTL